MKAIAIALLTTGVLVAGPRLEQVEKTTTGTERKCVVEFQELDTRKFVSVTRTGHAVEKLDVEHTPSQVEAYIRAAGKRAPKFSVIDFSFAYSADIDNAVQEAVYQDGSEVKRVLLQQITMQSESRNLAPEADVLIGLVVDLCATE